MLRKVRPLPWESHAKAKIAPIVKTAEQAAAGDNVETETINSEGLLMERVRDDRSPARKKRRIRGYREDPFFFFDESEPIWPSIRLVLNYSMYFLNVTWSDFFASGLICLQHV